jgi:hypothetical protein
MIWLTTLRCSSLPQEPTSTTKSMTQMKTKTLTLHHLRRSMSPSSSSCRGLSTSRRPSVRTRCDSRPSRVCLQRRNARTSPEQGQTPSASLLDVSSTAHKRIRKLACSYKPNRFIARSTRPVVSAYLRATSAATAGASRPCRTSSAIRVLSCSVSDF